jgi:hypothetical protein
MIELVVYFIFVLFDLVLRFSLVLINMNTIVLLASRGNPKYSLVRTPPVQPARGGEDPKGWWRRFLRKLLNILAALLDFFYEFLIMGPFFGSFNLFVWYKNRVGLGYIKKGHWIAENWSNYVKFGQLLLDCNSGWKFRAIYIFLHSLYWVFFEFVFV